MIRCLIYILLLLLLAVPMSAVPYELTEEYTQKKAILDEKAAMFRAETGFQGHISYNYQYLKFSTFFGNFSDIEVTAPQDTVFMKHVFDRIISKVMPYLSAREGQLLKGKVRSNSLGSGIILQQIVNGYRVEGGGGVLKIHYNVEVSKFNIVDATVDISSDFVPINITLEQAIKLAQDEVFKGTDAQPYNPRIAYTYEDTNEGTNYFLSYILHFWDYSVYIDVSKAVIRRITPKLRSPRFDSH